MWVDWLWILAAYFAGSVPFGYLWVRIVSGADIRAQGSGNIGATNVARVTGSRLAAAVVLGLDILKGWLPVWAYLERVIPASSFPSSWAAMGIGLAALAGHCFPVFLSFRGGKGAATGLGVIWALFPLAAALALAVWLLSAALTRYVSVSSILAALSFPVWCALGWTGSAERQGPRWLSFAVACALAVVVRHHANLRRLAAGTEPKIGAKRDHP